MGQPSEYLKPVEVAPVLPKELVEAGVEHSEQHREVTLPPVVKQAGVEPARESIPHHTMPSGAVQLPPLNRDQLLEQKKTGPVTDTVRWLATYFIRQLDKIAYQKLNQ